MYVCQTIVGMSSVNVLYNLISDKTVAIKLNRLAVLRQIPNGHYCHLLEWGRQIKFYFYSLKLWQQVKLCCASFCQHKLASSFKLMSPLWLKITIQLQKFSTYSSTFWAQTFLNKILLKLCIRNLFVSLLA